MCITLLCCLQVVLPETFEQGEITLKKKLIHNPFMVDSFGGPLEPDVDAPGLD